MANKRGHEIPTIDVALVTVETYDNPGEELVLDTSSRIQVSPQTEEEDAVKLVVKGVLRAQKPSTTTITGNTITITDNVFNPELAEIMQGGETKYWADADHSSTQDTDAGFGVASYRPPVAGSKDKGKPFKFRAYSAVYNAAGILTMYERITYPNCQGTPVPLNSEDGVFRAPEYTINSAPKENEAPYEINYIDPEKIPALPDKQGA